MRETQVISIAHGAFAVDDVAVVRYAQSGGEDNSIAFDADNVD